MAKITWTGASSSLWDDGANWTGGVVPGAADTAEILPLQSDDSFTVDVVSPITVGTLILDASKARLSAGHHLTAGQIELDRGVLNATSSVITGTLIARASALMENYGTTVFQTGVIEGALNVRPSHHVDGTLVFEHGLTLTGFNGQGGGVLNDITGSILIHGSTGLQSGTVTAHALSWADLPGFTLSAPVTIRQTVITLSNGQTLTNDGQITGGAIDGAVSDNQAAGIVINAGTLSGVSVQAGQLINDGVIAGAFSD